SLGLGQIEALGDLRRHFLNLHPEPASLDLAVLAQLLDHGFCKARRDREADADRTAIGRVDRGVDADHLALEVKSRATRIAAVDRGIELKVVVIGAGMDVAAARRDYARTHRAAEAEGIAYGQHPVADLKRIAFAPADIGQRVVDVDLEE